MNSCFHPVAGCAQTLGLINMHRSTIHMTLTGLAFLLASCGTVITRAVPENRGHLDYYPATQYDAFMIRTRGGGVDGRIADQGLDHSAAIPLHMLDLPISVVADTIMIPVDFQRKTQMKARRSLTESKSDKRGPVSHQHAGKQ